MSSRPTQKAEKGLGASTGAEGNPKHDVASPPASNELLASGMPGSQRQTTAPDDGGSSNTSSTTSTTSGGVGAFNVELTTKGPPNAAAETQRAGQQDRNAAAETQRVLAETQRVLAETQRVLAETQRAGQQDRNAAAETQRFLAETQRVLAETQRAGQQDRTDQAPRGRNDDDRGLLKLDKTFLGLTFQAGLALMIYRNQPQQGDSSSANPSLLSSILFTSVGAATLFGFAFTMSGMILQKHHQNAANFCSYAGVFLGALGFFFMMDIFAGKGLDWLVCAVGGVLLLVFAYTLRRKMGV